MFKLGKNVGICHWDRGLITAPETSEKSLTAISKRPKIGFQDNYRLMQVKSIAECSKREHSAILLTFIKLTFVIKIIVLSIFELPCYTVLLYLAFGLKLHLLKYLYVRAEMILARESDCSHALAHQNLCWFSCNIIQILKSLLESFL